MQRREVIKLVTLATGAALSAPLMSSLLTGCKKPVEEAGTDYALKYFNGNEFQHVKTIVDIILPKTDSPSATEVGVHKIIDNMVGTVYSPDQKENYTKRFSSLIEHLNGSEFLESDTAEQEAILKQLMNSSEDKDKTAQAAFLELKQQTIAYYLSTEEIATKHLNYLPVPGKYEPCITLEEAGGKAWAI